MKRGIYFKANDVALDWCVAFLNSVRLHNPTIEICLIPFGGSIELLSALAPIYEFDIFKDNDVLMRCDAISSLFHSEVRGFYRKLAAWAGDYDEFIYIDTDTVVTRELTWIFPLLNQYDIIVADGPSPGNKQFVWRDSISAVKFLSKEQVEFSANMGFFASRKQIFGFSDIERSAKRAKEIAIHMDVDRSSEQPFMNFLIVTSGFRYASLRALLKQGHNVCISWWGGSNGGIVFNGKIWIVGHKGKLLIGRCPIFLVHWAGETTKTYRGSSWLTDCVGSITQDPDFGFLTWFRYRSLWEYYAFCKGGRRKAFNVADISRLRLRRRAATPGNSIPAFLG